MFFQWFQQWHTFKYKKLEITKKTTICQIFFFHFIFEVNLDFLKIFCQKNFCSCRIYYHPCLKCSRTNICQQALVEGGMLVTTRLWSCQIQAPCSHTGYSSAVCTATTKLDYTIVLLGGQWGKSSLGEIISYYELPVDLLLLFPPIRGPRRFQENQ